MFFMSAKLRGWVRSYINSQIKYNWRIKEISTFTATKNDDIWNVYVELSGPGGRWTNGTVYFSDCNGVCLKEDFATNEWKKPDQFNLLIKYLNLRYVPEQNTIMPAHFEKEKKNAK